mmetsp:Transcript_87022/g.198634  ORF Transcript_87022/g.198634 Transcript_87022/m.198634 type:complete len:221 (-) Transcript_87022:78-740(-)
MVSARCCFRASSTCRPRRTFSKQVVTAVTVAVRLGVTPRQASSPNTSPASKTARRWPLTVISTRPKSSTYINAPMVPSSQTLNPLGTTCGSHLPEQADRNFMPQSLKNGVLDSFTSAVKVLLASAVTSGRNVIRSFGQASRAMHTASMDTSITMQDSAATMSTGAANSEKMCRTCPRTDPWAKSWFGLLTVLADPRDSKIMLLHFSPRLTMHCPVQYSFS